MLIFEYKGRRWKRDLVVPPLSAALRWSRAPGPRAACGVRRARHRGERDCERRRGVNYTLKRSTPYRSFEANTPVSSLLCAPLDQLCACGWMSPPIPRTRSENPIATEPPKDRPRRSISFAEGLHPDADRPCSWDAERTPLLGPDGKPRQRERLTALIRGTGKATFPQNGSSEDDASSRGRTFLGGIFCGLIVALVITSAAFIQPVRPGSIIHPPIIPIRHPSYLIHAEHGAVASESESCSIIGVKMLKQGGSAVDAAIAATVCIGVVNMFSSGIGGGGFMVIKPPNDTAYTIDFRETAPSASNATMFLRDPLSSIWGGLAVGVPGEIRGLAEAHRRWGKLPWRKIIEPSVKLSTRFKVTRILAERLQVSLGPKHSLHGSDNNAGRRYVYAQRPRLGSDIRSDGCFGSGRRPYLSRNVLKNSGIDRT